jgi:hypothetical protein
VRAGYVGSAVRCFLSQHTDDAESAVDLRVFQARRSAASRVWTAWCVPLTGHRERGESTGATTNEAQIHSRFFISAVMKKSRRCGHVEGASGRS